MKKITLIPVILILTACAAPQRPPSDRLAAIPADAVKRAPETDAYPPVLHSDEFEAPAPLPAPVNSAGAEDSAFIPAGGSTLYYFFTPDVRVPVEGQLTDGVTGIYYTDYGNGTWAEPQRLWLQEPGKLSLDGCLFTYGDRAWYCTAREGLTGLHWFTADRVKDETWADYRHAGFPDEYEVGEIYLSNDGASLYFHSVRAGGYGGLDLWTSSLYDGSWFSPVNLAAVNSPSDEGWPALSHDETELWFTRWHEGSPALFRCLKEGSAWAAPELIVSQFADESTLDSEGNLYFTHHFYQDGVMLEADIYVAHRK